MKVKEFRELLSTLNEKDSDRDLVFEVESDYGTHEYTPTGHYAFYAGYGFSGITFEVTSSW